MVFYRSRFRTVDGSEVDDELICVLCQGVFDHAAHLDPCGHTFCTGCIELAMADNPGRCPIDCCDNSTATICQSVSRMVTNYLSRLRVKCKNVDCNRRF